jgi:hypothetical protein
MPWRRRRAGGGVAWLIVFGVAKVATGGNRRGGFGGVAALISVAIRLACGAANAVDILWLTGWAYFIGVKPSDYSYREAEEIDKIENGCENESWR